MYLSQSPYVTIQPWFVLLAHVGLKVLSLLYLLQAHVQLPVSITLQTHEQILLMSTSPTPHNYYMVKIQNNTKFKHGELVGVMEIYRENILAKGSPHIWRTWVGDALNMKRLEHTGM
jgi:hypothetical protein